MSMTARTLRLAFLACLAVSLPLAAAPQGNVELLNQITVLRAELQALRAQIEELQRDLALQRDQGRSQYLDLDSRLGRLEGGAPAAGPASSVIEVPADSVAGDAPPPETIVEPAAVASEDEKADYLDAFDALKRGDYVASASAFESFLMRHPAGTYAPNALYWLGESYYVTQNYDMAERQFRAVIDRFPHHDKAAGALLKVGLSQYGQGAVEAAASTLAEVIARYPGTDVARTAGDSLRSMRLEAL